MEEPTYVKNEDDTFEYNILGKRVLTEWKNGPYAAFRYWTSGGDFNRKRRKKRAKYLGRGVGEFLMWLDNMALFT